MARKVRNATKAELIGYMASHRKPLLDAIRGLVDIKLMEDTEGHFALFTVRKHADPEDPREGSVDTVTKELFWPSEFPEVRVRAKIRRA